MSTTTKPFLAIAGPTAGGKSSTALALAEDCGGEIISCDSVQVYRDFDIGCAKPTAAERARVPHHLVDVAQWHEPFDAQRYRSLATVAIADIRARGREPILCGGTGLYLRSLRFGLMAAPPANEVLRQQLYDEEASHPGALFARLRALDPATAQAIDRNNLVRLVRAVEVSLLAGVPVSDLRARHGFAREEVPLLVLAIDWPTVTLQQRITVRVEAMIAQGLIAEVERLLAAGVASTARPMRSLGYAETSEVVLGRAPRAGLEDRIVRATRAYARRQRTWLRRERDVQWIEATSLEQALAAARAAHARLT